MDYQEKRQAERDAAIILHFTIISIIWALVPIWFAFWLPALPGGPMIAWTAVVLGLAWTAGCWYAVLDRGASVWRTGIAIGIIIFGSGGFGQLSQEMNWWSPIGLIFVLDVLAWRLVSPKSK